jgi:hypothetical protein
MKTKKIITKKISTNQIIKIIDNYCHSGDSPKHNGKTFDKYLYRILKVNPNFIDDFKKSKSKKKEPNYIDITNAYFNLGGQGLFKRINLKSEKNVLDKIREKRIQKYGYDYDPPINFDGEIEEDEEDED